MSIFAENCRYRLTFLRILIPKVISLTQKLKMHVQKGFQIPKGPPFGNVPNLNKINVCWLFEDFDNLIGSPLLILSFSIGPKISNKKSTLPSQNFKLWDPETGFQHFWAGPLNFQEDACIYAGNKIFLKYQKMMFFRYFPTFFQLFGVC